RQHRVDQIAPFILLMPIFGVLTAHVLLGEAITPVVLAGGSIILIGLILVVCTPTAEEAVETKPLPLDVGNIG
ncbi:DMT family transporter, partial [Mesorhizobium sp. M7A.F.Ca.US.001.04.1.1]